MVMLLMLITIISKAVNSELYTFIQDIYLTCKNLGVTPANISSWINDLFGFHSVKNSNIINNSSFFD